MPHYFFDPITQYKRYKSFFYLAAHKTDQVRHVISLNDYLYPRGFSCELRRGFPSPANIRKNMGVSLFSWHFTHIFIASIKYTTTCTYLISRTCFSIASNSRAIRSRHFRIFRGAWPDAIPASAAARRIGLAVTGICCDGADATAACVWGSHLRALLAKIAVSP